MRGSGSFIHKTGSTLFFDRLIVLSYAKTCPIFLHLDLFQFSPSSSLAFFFLFWIKRVTSSVICRDKAFRLSWDHLSSKMISFDKRPPKIKKKKNLSEKKIAGVYFRSLSHEPFLTYSARRHDRHKFQPFRVNRKSTLTFVLELLNFCQLYNWNV